MLSSKSFDVADHWNNDPKPSGQPIQLITPKAQRSRFASPAQSPVNALEPSRRLGAFASGSSVHSITSIQRKSSATLLNTADVTAPVTPTNLNPRHSFFESRGDSRASSSGAVLPKETQSVRTQLNIREHHIQASIRQREALVSEALEYSMLAAARNSTVHDSVNALKFKLIECLAEIRNVNVVLLEHLDTWQSLQQSLAAHSSQKHNVFAPFLPRPFLWNDYDYIRKMQSDLLSIDESSVVGDLVGFALTDNIFILPPSDEIQRGVSFVHDRLMMTDAEAARIYRIHTQLPYISALFPLAESAPNSVTTARLLKSLSACSLPPTAPPTAPESRPSSTSFFADQRVPSYAPPMSVDWRRSTGSSPFPMPPLSPAQRGLTSAESNFEFGPKRNALPSPHQRRPAPSPLSTLNVSRSLPSLLSPVKDANAGSTRLPVALQTRTSTTQRLLNSDQVRSATVQAHSSYIAPLTPPATRPSSATTAGMLASITTVVHPIVSNAQRDPSRLQLSSVSEATEHDATFFGDSSSTINLLSASRRTAVRTPKSRISTAESKTKEQLLSQFQMHYDRQQALVETPLSASPHPSELTGFAAIHRDRVEQSRSNHLATLHDSHPAHASSHVHSEPVSAPLQASFRLAAGAASFQDRIMNEHAKDEKRLVKTVKAMTPKARSQYALAETTDGLLSRKLVNSASQQMLMSRFLDQLPPVEDLRSHLHQQLQHQLGLVQHRLGDLKSPISNTGEYDAATEFGVRKYILEDSLDPAIGPTLRAPIWKSDLTEFDKHLISEAQYEGRPIPSVLAAVSQALKRSDETSQIPAPSPTSQVLDSSSTLLTEQVSSETAEPPSRDSVANLQAAVQNAQQAVAQLPVTSSTTVESSFTLASLLPGPSDSGGLVEVMSPVAVAASEPLARRIAILQQRRAVQNRKGSNSNSTNRLSKRQSVVPSIENPLIKVAHRPAAKLIRLELASAQTLAAFASLQSPTSTFGGASQLSIDTTTSHPTCDAVISIRDDFFRIRLRILACGAAASPAASPKTFVGNHVVNDDLDAEPVVLDPNALFDSADTENRAASHVKSTATSGQLRLSQASRDSRWATQPQIKIRAVKVPQPVVVAPLAQSMVTDMTPIASSPPHASVSSRVTSARSTQPRSAREIASESPRESASPTIAATLKSQSPAPQSANFGFDFPDPPAAPADAMLPESPHSLQDSQVLPTESAVLNSDSYSVAATPRSAHIATPRSVQAETVPLVFVPESSQSVPIPEALELVLSLSEFAHALDANSIAAFHQNDARDVLRAIVSLLDICEFGGSRELVVGMEHAPAKNNISSDWKNI